MKIYFTITFSFFMQFSFGQMFNWNDLQLSVEKANTSYKNRFDVTLTNNSKDTL